MAVNLSIYAGVGWQFFDNNGVPLSGGLVYTYLAGTSTPLATYTSSAGTVAHSNPIVLDSAGKVPGGEIWLDYSKKYKFIVKTSEGVLLNTYDNLGGSFNAAEMLDNFSGNGTTTVFTLTSTTPVDENNTSVFINGVYQQKNTYSVSVNVITFSQAPPYNSTIEVVYS